jgi:hypothetical protein
MPEYRLELRDDEHGVVWPGDVSVSWCDQVRDRGFSAVRLPQVISCSRFLLVLRLLPRHWCSPWLPSVVILNFVQDNRTARGRIDLAGDRVPVEGGSAVIVDSVRQRNEHSQCQLALRLQVGHFCLASTSLTSSGESGLKGEWRPVPALRLGPI